MRSKLLGPTDISLFNGLVGVVGGHRSIMATSPQLSKLRLDVRSPAGLLLQRPRLVVLRAGTAEYDEERHHDRIPNPHLRRSRVVGATTVDP